MKSIKIVVTVITICIMISCAFTMTACADGNPEFGEFYPRLSVVVERHTDTIICRDKEGNLWTFFCEEDDGWEVGDLCNLLMWNVDEDITLHEVVEVYWEGYVEDLGLFFTIAGWR